MKYTAEERHKILSEARTTLARLRMDEAIAGLREERATRAEAEQRGALSRAVRRSDLIYKVTYTP
jgi:hypothetical protein